MEVCIILYITTQVFLLQYKAFTFHKENAYEKKVEEEEHISGLHHIVRKVPAGEKQKIILLNYCQLFTV